MVSFLEQMLGTEIFLAFLSFFLPCRDFILTFHCSMTYPGIIFLLPIFSHDPKTLPVFLPLQNPDLDR